MINYTANNCTRLLLITLKTFNSYDIVVKKILDQSDTSDCIVIPVKLLFLIALSVEGA